jgi:hypothetical protein
MPPRKATTMTMGRTMNAERGRPNDVARSLCEEVVDVVIVLASGVVVAPVLGFALDGPGVVTTVVTVWVAVVVVVVGGRVTVEVEVCVVVDVDVDVFVTGEGAVVFV